MTTESFLSSLRAQTRKSRFDDAKQVNLLSDKETSPCMGDDGCSSALTLKGGKVVRFGEVCLPPSKSESNRALMIAAYGGFAPDFQNLSDSGDTMVLAKALESMSFQHGAARGKESMLSKAIHKTQQGASIIDIADCGTAARFLTTYLACHEGHWILTGTARMKQRPVKPLVDALHVLGAEIQYVEQEGCLPLRIVGKSLSGGKVSIDMTQSSQFASSLLLAAPMFPQGLEIELLGSLSSLPYLEMTLAMMCHFLAQVEKKGRTVIVTPQPYRKQSFTIEPDWTAASYWYEMAAFSEECEIKLHGLSVPSTGLGTADSGTADSGTAGSGTANLQGDAIITEWMKLFGVCTTALENGVLLTKMPFERRPLSFDFTNCPDLYPTMAATCAGLNVEANLTGLDNLALKESDRVVAMQTELAKLGNRPLRFCAHNDHRIVMALAPLSMKFGPVAFDHPEVVQKSYPDFWKDASFLSVY